jgi:hypothetical protein
MIIGGLFGWLGFRKGLYVAIVMLFNLMIGIYIGVLTSLRILNMNPEYGQSEYYAAFTMFFLSIIIFAVLQIIAWFYFLHDTLEYFPRLIEQLGGALCGFLFGYFLLGLTVLAVCVTPVSKGHIPSLLPQREKMIQFSSSPVIGACNFIGICALECFDGQPNAIIDTLLSLDQDSQQVPKAPSGGIDKAVQ